MTMHKDTKKEKTLKEVLIPTFEMATYDIVNLKNKKMINVWNRENQCFDRKKLMYLFDNNVEEVDKFLSEEKNSKKGT